MLAAAGTKRVNDIISYKKAGHARYDGTALVTSCEKGYTKIVEILIGAKADVNLCAEVTTQVQSFLLFCLMRRLLSNSPRNRQHIMPQAKAMWMC